MRGAGFNGRESYVVISCILFYVQLYRFIMTIYRVIVIPEGSMNLLRFIAYSVQYAYTSHTNSTNTYEQAEVFHLGRDFCC